MENTVQFNDAPPSTVHAPMISQDAADQFLRFLAQRQIAAFLFTQAGNTMISLCNVPPAEAQRLLEEWQNSSPRPSV